MEGYFQGKGALHAGRGGGGGVGGETKAKNNRQKVKSQTGGFKLKVMFHFVSELKSFKTNSSFYLD